MNGFLLDTNVPSELTRPKPDLRLKDWVAAHDDLYLSVITPGELRKGVSLLPPGRRREGLEGWFVRSLPLLARNVLPIDGEIATRWGLMSAARQLRGMPLGMADGLIACTALHYGLTLVTRNVKDFAELGLTILNPWEV